MQNLARFAFWFLIEIAGSWFIWASYMAIKFISEDAQGQKAAFSVLHNTNVGGLILIPVMLTIVWTVAAIGIAVTVNFD